MSTVDMPETKLLPLASIQPYWRNPRRIPPEAVAAVRSSIEKYGYQQPIVVDQNHVIVVGHTRYQALTEMGATHVPVFVSHMSEEKIKAYRLIDNRTNENAEWDHSSLVMELREFEQELLKEFFPHVNLEIDVINAALSDVTDEEAATASTKVNALKDHEDPLTTNVECPACFGVFHVTTASLPGMTRLDLEQLKVAADAAGE